MAITGNFKGTTYPSFTIGNKGITLYQGTVTPPGTTGQSGDLYVYSAGTLSNLYQNLNGTWSVITGGGGGGTGSVTSVATNNGLTGGPITTTGTIGLATIANSRILANISGSTQVPVANSLTAIIDTIGSAQGDILYRNGSVWTVLTPGTSGGFLQTNGTAANPTWTTLPIRPQIVTTRNAVPSSAWGNGTSSRFDTLVECRRLLFIGPSNVSDLQIAMPGFYLKNDATGEHAFGNSYSWTAALELGNGSTEFPFYAQGSLTMQVPSGVPFIMTDPILGIDFAAGTTLYIRHRCAVASSQNDLFPGGDGELASTLESGYVAPNATTQVYSTGTMSVPSGGASFGGPLPMLVIGRPVTPHISVIINGDSISVGNNDTIDNTTGAIGFISRGLTGTLAGGNSVPYHWNGVGGDRLSENTLATAPRKRSCWPFATHLICELSTNDIAAGTSLATCQTLTTAIWQAAKNTVGPYGRPLHVTHTKCMPRTTSKQYVNTAAVAAGGTGYATSSTFNVTIVGGTLNGGATATTVSVTTNSSGVVTTVNSVTNNGGYTSAGKPTTPNSPTGGSGSGLSLTLTFGGWSSAADQTPVAGFTVGGVRDLYNTWLDTQVGGGLLDAVIDPNVYVEDQSNQGCWLTNGTLNYPSTDGVHPNNALHVLAAASVSAWITGKTP